MKKAAHSQTGHTIRPKTIDPTEPLPSKYQEDVFVNGHSTVWGSYFHRGAFRWGYADDHSLIRNSYCTGKAGQKLNDRQNEMQYAGVAGSTMLAQAPDLLKSIPSGNNNNNNNGDCKKRKAQEQINECESPKRIPLTTRPPHRMFTERIILQDFQQYDLHDGFGDEDPEINQVELGYRAINLNPASTWRDNAWDDGVD